MADGGKGFTVHGFTVTNDNEGDKQPQREKIIDAVMTAGVTFWQDTDGHAYATVPHDVAYPDGAVMHLPVRRRRFALVCRRLYGAANPVKGQRGTRAGSVSDNAMSEAIPAFEAIALGTHEAREPAVRLIAFCGAIWIDLGDETYRAIRVTADGWAVVERANAPLIRSDGLRALPMPARTTGALVGLKRLLNIGDDEEGTNNFRLIVSWLVAALYPAGPYPVMALDGEQGSGKTTTARMLRKLVDPNAADLRGMPRNEDDLLIAALNGRVVALDNVSYIENDMADALCRVATGAGFGKRTLYSDLGETIVSVARPILLNGIPSLLARGDLADRSIAVTLPHIPDEMRRPESAVWADFETAAPGVLALLLDGLTMALRRLPTLHLERMPRMADFARLACAAAPAFNWTESDMLTAMDANRIASIETVVEADPIAGAIRAILSDYSDGWAGIASLLLEAVNARVPPEVKNERGWPKDGTRLSTRLKRVSPALRRVGVEVVLPTAGGRAGRTIILRPSGNRNERSHRSQRSDGGQTYETEEKTGNARERPKGSGNADERSGGNTERSRNAASRPEQSVNPLDNNGGNAGNAGNAVFSSLRARADGADVDGADEVVI